MLFSAKPHLHQILTLKSNNLRKMKLPLCNTSRRLQLFHMNKKPTLPDWSVELAKYIQPYDLLFKFDDIKVDELMLTPKRYKLCTFMSLIYFAPIVSIKTVSKCKHVCPICIIK